MNRCRNCKYWQIPEGCNGYVSDSIYNPIDPDTFESMKMPFEVRECKSGNITLFERNPNPKGVSLQDGSDYFATMYTGPLYGCVNFKKKEE
jgi:hypothetical protein